MASMEAADNIEPPLGSAAEQLQTMTDARNSVWFPNPSDSPIRRYPVPIGFWTLFTSTAVAFSFSEGTGDGWQAWLSNFLILTIAGGSVAIERRVQIDRGLRLAWFAPGDVHKKQAKSMGLSLVVLVAVPLGVLFIMNKPFWTIFLATLTLIACFVWYTDRRYHRTHTQLSSDANHKLVLPAILGGVTEVELDYLKQQTNVPPTELSEYLISLSNQGYVSTRKDSKDRTWYSMTPQGRTAFLQYQQSLRATATATTNR